MYAKMRRFVDQSNEIADNSKQRKEKERKEEKTLITTSTTTACACAREKFSFKAFHDIQEHDEDWQQYAVAQINN